MPASCSFCGNSGTMTSEHVLGTCLSKIGLDLTPAPHGAGRLNRITRKLGTRPPFGQTVRNVCSDCNNGWMSRLETVAQRVLTPFILGQPGQIAQEDLGAVAAWTQKTALTAMLVSSEEDRADGYGLPQSEYSNLHARRDEALPLDASQFWIGRYSGVRVSSIQVTPLVVDIDGLPEPDVPHGYAMTVVVGQLVLHGVGFTTPSLQVEVSTRVDLEVLWPGAGPLSLPNGPPLGDEAFLAFAGGRHLYTTEKHVEVRPWRPATDLPPSRPVGTMIELPTPCGKYAVFYPAALADEALCGRYYAFATTCECPNAYLIHTEPDGAHCKAVGSEEVISDLYENLPGEEYVFSDEGGSFVCKRLVEEPGRP